MLQWEKEHISRPITEIISESDLCCKGSKQEDRRENLGGMFYGRSFNFPRAGKIIFWKIYLFKKQSEWVTESECYLPSESTPKCPPNQVWARLKTEVRNSIQVSKMGGKDWSTWVIIGLPLRHINRKSDWKHNSWDLNQHSTVGCQRCKQWLNPLCQSHFLFYLNSPCPSSIIFPTSKVIWSH